MLKVVPTSFELLRELDPEHLDRVVHAGSKKLREELFRRCGIRPKSSSFSLKGASRGARVERLREKLREGTDPGSEVCEEVIRSYFYQKRDLLAQALDFLGVRHEDGLTDDDIDFLETLENDRSKALMDELEKTHPAEDVKLYFGFMGIPEPE